ncbi:MAG: hypothetical protein R2731_16440 [Nocardioides sp.]
MRSLLLHQKLPPGGSVYLFYEANRPELVPTIVKNASAALVAGASESRSWSRRRPRSSG